jgi:toxin CcdB
MAKYDVYRLREGRGFLLDCQADVLGDLNTRFVVPLLPENEAPKPATRLNPIFNVTGRRVVMVTQFAAAIAVRELGDPLGALIGDQDAIGNALDMLIIGF